MAKQGDLCCGSLWWENVSVLTMSVSISWLWYMFARCHHQGAMGRGYTGSLSLLFSYDYIRLHNYLNRKYLIKKKKKIPTRKKMETSHTVQMQSFYLRRTISRQCPLGKASLIIRYIKINHYSRQGTKIHASVTSIQ